MSRLTPLAAIVLATVLAATAPAAITGATRIADTSDSLSQPIYVTHAPGRADQLFIVERGGAIRILDRTDNSVLSTPLVTVTSLNTSGEGGLLSMAFHPDFANNGKFYVNATLTNGNATPANMSTHILEYTLSTTNPNLANPRPRQVLSFGQPQNNHNGGWIGFGPDGYLYVASGDGGGGGDTGTGHTSGTGNAQDLTSNLLGKMLRIDVDGDDFTTDATRNYAIPTDNPFVGETGDDEIWAYGLRNPWRNSFDRITGDLWIGDVGQGFIEEIDFQSAASEGGENYGWRVWEGSDPFGTSTTPAVDPVFPVYEYEHTSGSGNPDLEGNAVNGGYVYRGPDADLRGMYLFSDSSTSRVWRFNPANPNGTVARINTLLSTSGTGGGTIDNVVSFGEDSDGNIYIVDIGGEIYRINTDIMLTGDFNGSGAVDAADYDIWQSQFGSTGTFDADANQDGTVDAADYTLWRDNLGRALPGALAPGTVPEPAGVTLLLAMACATWIASRRRA